MVQRIIQNGKILWLLAWLVIWAVSDIRRRKINAGSVWFVAATGVLWQLAEGRLFTWDIAGGIAAGGAFWLFSILSGERMGKGDAFVILCMGVYLGFRISLTLWMAAFLLSSAGALYLLLVKKKTGRYAMPFLPFLAAAALLVMGLLSGKEGL